MGGVQESPLHVYLDGPATAKPLGQVSSMESPILYNLWNGEMVRTSCTTGLRHCVPAGIEIFQIYYWSRILNECREMLYNPQGSFNVIYSIGSALTPPFDQKTWRLRIPDFP